MTCVSRPALHSISSNQLSNTHCTYFPFGVCQVVLALLQALQTLLPMRAQRRRLPNQLAAMLDRGLLKLAKSVTQIQQTHPWCAAATMPSTRIRHIRRHI